MDVAGSFLELSCVRVALIPAGAAIPDYRFEELTSYLTAFREIPVSALPRRAAVPRGTGSATFSSMPAAFREVIAEVSSTGPPLHRSLSASRDIGRPSPKTVLPTLRNSVSKPIMPKATKAENGQSGHVLGSVQSRLGSQASMTHKRRQSEPVASRGNADLNMMGPDVDSSFRLRFDIIHRDHAGVLLMKPFSEWDDFHSSKIWGVIGIVDCTQPGVCDSAENRKHAIFDAYDDFNTALTNFKDASVRRLVVFTSPDAAQETGSFILDDPKPLSKDANAPALHFSVGYVPERLKVEGTRREVRAQIIHFSGLLLNSIDRDCWKRRESPQSDLLLSPIDEKYTADRQSKLAKRRAGRLDKVLGDCFLLMGNPTEALGKYNSAIEKAKTNSDRLWLAGAMEGWSAAHVLTHVGSGGSISDPALSDRLIEYYAEIYKLYQKKRVAEPETAAALRLAGFLGRWTNRRKDALDAAEHAATVGEGLRVQKRAALWEALARFSDQMGCRRKAALYLYRLGHLNASQSIWSSAVTLMIASERQLIRDGRKPWSDLNRKVLLTAAGHAESAGDSSTTARLYVEALVTPSLDSKIRQKEDENLIKSLSRSHVPTYLPAAQDVLELGDVTALQMPGLSIRHRTGNDGTQENELRMRDSPFIYNPSEAKERAKAAAVARRAVTWIRGEHAQVSIRLYNKTSAELVIDVVAVLMRKPNNLHRDEDESALKAKADEVLEKDILSNDPDDSIANHTQNVRDALTWSSRIAKTIPESVTLPPQELKSAVVKYLTVVPRRTGPLHVRGLLIRLFNGALVIIQADAFDERESQPVNVISALPRISIQPHSTEGGTIESTAGRTPLTVYDGEQRRFHVDIENTGTEDIGWMKARILSSRPEEIRIFGHDLHDGTILQDLEHHGGSKTFTIEVLGAHSSSTDDEHGTDASDTAKNHTSLSIISIIVEYEGKESRGTVRESSTHVKVSSKSALWIRRLDFFTGPSKLVYNPRLNGQSVFYASIEVRNDVSAPATVKFVPDIERQYDGSKRTSGLGEEIVFSGENHLVENGASARLICSLPDAKIAKLRSEYIENCSEPQRHNGEIAFRILWKLPALGRGGTLGISNYALCKALKKTLGIGSQQPQNNKLLPTKISMNCVEINWSIDFNTSNIVKSEVMKPGSIPVVKAGKFWTAKVIVHNKSISSFSKQTMLDIEVTQMGERGIAFKSGVIVVGITKGVVIGSLPASTGEFVHEVRIRVSSTGTFQLQARLYDGTSVSNCTEDASSNISKLEDQTELSSHRDNQGGAFLRSISPATKAITADVSTHSQHKLLTTTPPHGSSNLSTPTGSTIPPYSAFEPSSIPVTSRTLQRVSVPKKKKGDEGNRLELLPNTVYPSTVDSYPEADTRTSLPIMLACSIFPFFVVRRASENRYQKGTCSSGDIVLPNDMRTP